ncbi:MAG: ABC transporter ATP-binding protein [Promethearchaeati archaeon SRVP18_Atabeyarchaeia-1]
MAEKLITLKDVSKVYHLGAVKVNALTGINLEIAEGEFVIIQGPSGAGKTTLLNIIAGLDNVTSGTIKVRGVRIDSATEDYLSGFRCLNIGFVFQMYNLISTFTAIENIEFPIEIAGGSAEKAARFAKSILKRLGLTSRAFHLPAQLSGGEQQRLAFGRAIANDPPIILADEPIGNLDRASAQKIISILDELKKQRKTIVVVSHDESTLKLADRILNLEDGRIGHAR